MGSYPMGSHPMGSHLMRRPFALLWLFFLSPVQAQCLHPNGSVTQEQWHAPCSRDSSNPLSTICCATDRSGAPGTSFGDAPVRDECMDNGLCMNRAKNSQTGVIDTIYWREECTVRDWRSGRCLNVCTDNVNGGNQMMKPCDGTPTSERWCCGNTLECCASNPIFIARRFSGANETIASTSSSSTATSSNAPNSNSSSSSQLGGGAIAGIVIGALVGLGLVFGAGFIIARRTTAKSRQAISPGTPDAAAFTDYNSDGPTAIGHVSEQKTYFAHEADTLDAQVAEAPAGNELYERAVPQELP